MVKVVIKAEVIDGIYVDVMRGLREWLSEEIIMLLSLCSMNGVEILGLIIGFKDGQSLSGPVYGWVGDMKPGEFKDDVFLATAHDVEEMF